MTTRRVLGVAAAVGLLAGAACSGDGGVEGAAAQTGEAEADAGGPPSLTAMGVGRASAPPDTMVVTLNVRTDGDSAAATMDEASVRARQLLDTARGQGVAEEDLQTVNVSVFPRFDEDGNRIVGYSADNAFTVRYRDLDTAGALLDQLVGVGGNFVRVQDLSLRIDDPSAVQDDARTDAVERARAQAEQLAAAAGVELGDVRRISEVPFGMPFAGGFTELAASRAAQDAAVPVPIAPGSQEVAVQVAVVFDIE